MHTSKQYFHGECYSRRSGKEIIGLDREHYKKFFQFYYSEDVAIYGCLHCFIEAYEKGLWRPEYFDYTWSLIPNCCTSSRAFNFPKKGPYLGLFRRSRKREACVFFNIQQSDRPLIPNYPQDIEGHFGPGALRVALRLPSDPGVLRIWGEIRGLLRNTERGHTGPYSRIRGLILPADKK